MYANFFLPGNFQGPCTATNGTNATPVRGRYGFGKVTTAWPPTTRKPYIELDVPDRTPLYNTYYQWVPLYLLILSALFYVPRVIWSKLEGGVQKHLSKNKTERNIDDIDSKKEKKDRLIDVSYIITNGS